MFWAISFSSSGGQIVLTQHLVLSLSVSNHPVHRLRKNSFSTCAPDVQMSGNNRSEAFMKKQKPIWGMHPTSTESFVFRFITKNTVIRKFGITVLSVVLYGYETWNLIWREENRLRVLSKTFWPFKEEVKQGGRNLQSEVKLLTIHT
jgi:hypothetical protein